MKRLISFMLLSVMLVFSGCSKDKVSDPAPDPDPVVTSTVFITAIFTKDVNTSIYKSNTSCYVSVSYIGSGSFIVTSVKLNEKNIPYDSTYRMFVAEWDSVFVTGSVIKLDVITSQGVYSVSNSLPAVGAGKTQIAIPGCIDLSYLELTQVE